MFFRDHSLISPFQPKFSCSCSSLTMPRGPKAREIILWSCGWWIGGRGKGPSHSLPVHTVQEMSFGLRWTDGIRASPQGKLWKCEVMPVFASSASRGWCRMRGKLREGLGGFKAALRGGRYRSRLLSPEAKVDCWTTGSFSCAVKVLTRGLLLNPSSCHCPPDLVAVPRIVCQSLGLSTLISVLSLPSSPQGGFSLLPKVSNTRHSAPSGDFWIAFGGRCPQPNPQLPEMVLLHAVITKPLCRLLLLPQTDP